MVKIKKLASLVLALISLSPAYAFAAQATSTIEQYPQEHPSADQASSVPPGLTSCFNYYTFGSVYATVSASLADVSAGSPISFSGTVTNKNTYAVSDVGVYAKVIEFRSTSKDVDGPDVVAWVPVASHIDLAAGESKPITYTWQVPSDTPSGDYEFATYVVADDRFSLSGLTFTDDVIGNSAPFTVLGQSTGAVRFDKSQVLVGGDLFHFAAFPPSVPNENPKEIITSVVSNTTAVPYDGSVTWKLYSWDSLSDGKLLDTQTQQLKIHPNATTSLTYIAPIATPASVYFLTGEFSTKDGSISYINVRFTKDGVNIPRLAFVGVDNGTAFACAHSMGNDDATNGKITLTVQGTDPLLSLLSTLGIWKYSAASYTGIIPGDIDALTTPAKNIKGSYTVTANLYQNGVLLESISTSYGTKSYKDYLVTIIVLVTLIIVLVLFFAWRGKKKKTDI